jgi:hypothetical protein
LLRTQNGQRGHLALREAIIFDYILARFRAVFIEIWATQVVAGNGQVYVYLPPPPTFLKTAIISQFVELAHFQISALQNSKFEFEDSVITKFS